MAEAALADAGRAHDTHREAVPLKGAPQGGVERGHLIVATNEARKSVPRGGLEPSPCRTGADHLEPLDGVSEALDRHWTERLHIDVASDEVQGRRRQQDASRARGLLHPRSEEHTSELQSPCNL